MSPTIAYSLTNLPRDIHSNITSHLQPKDEDRFQGTCAQICDVICHKKLARLLCYPTMKDLTPEIQNLTRLQKWQIPYRLTRLVSSANKLNETWKDQSSIHKLQLEWNVAERRPYHWALKEVEQIPTELLLITASFFPDPMLRSVRLNYKDPSPKWIDLSIALCLMTSPQKASSEDPELEQRIETQLAALIPQSSLFNSNNCYPGYNLDVIRNNLMTIALLFAAQKGFKDIYAKLLYLKNPSSPNENERMLTNVGNLLCMLCEKNLPPHYIKKVLNFQHEITRSIIHSACFSAADHNNREALESIFKVWPGDIIRQEELIIMRDSFQPNFIPDSQMWKDIFKTRAVHFPDDASRNQMLNLLNDEIARRYPPAPVPEPGLNQDDDILQEALLADAAGQRISRPPAADISGRSLSSANSRRLTHRHEMTILPSIQEQTEEPAHATPVSPEESKGPPVTPLEVTEEEETEIPVEVRSSRLLNRCCTIS